jgi:hypothetical protein
MIEGTIDGTPYEIAIGDRGQTLWETTQVAQERDEVWEDWSLGLGETKRESGRGYFFSQGWDASVRGALRLSPFFHNLNNTALTTGYGYFMESVETSGSTLNLDAYSTGKGSVGANALTISHTVAVQSERILIISAQLDNNTVGFSLTVTYGGIACTFLGGKAGASGTDTQAAFWFLLDPPTGANDIVITNNESTTVAIVAGAVSLYGANADDLFGTMVTATGTDGTPTVTVSTTAGEFVLAVAALDTNDAFTAGTNETERWDAAQSTDVTGAGFTQAGSDGGVMAPSIDGAATKWVMIAVPIKPASTTSRSIMFVSDETKIFKYTYDSDTGLTLDATDTTASAVAGSPAKANGNWYSPMGSGASAQKLTGITWADVTGTWKADHLSTYQKGVTPTVARVNSTTQHQVDFNEDTGDITDTWANGQKFGDSSAKITELLEVESQLIVCKENTAFDAGVEAESRVVIPFLDRGKIDADNGKGSFAFGDEIAYMSKGDLWRYRIGRGALPIGINTIRSFRKIASIPTPKSGRPAFGVHAGEYWYYLQNEGQLSHLIQARKRREGDPEGHELIQHSVLTIPLSKGLGVDSHNRLWIKGANSAQGARDIRVIELAEDGSLDTPNRKGQVAFSHSIFFDERNPGRPQDKVHIRHMTVELEGDWDATTPLQLVLGRDDATLATLVGSTITSSGVTTRNLTVGTDDTAYRIRPQLQLVPTGSYTPKNSDPQVLRVIVGIRFPEIVRIVIPAKDSQGKTAIDIEQNLRRLQNQGVVTFRRPGDTVTTFSAEITSVTDTMYATEKGFAHGLELQVRRWVTP